MKSFERDNLPVQPLGAPIRKEPEKTEPKNTETKRKGVFEKDGKLHTELPLPPSLAYSFQNAGMMKRDSPPRPIVSIVKVNESELLCINSSLFDGIYVCSRGGPWEYIPYVPFE